MRSLPSPALGHRWTKPCQDPEARAESDDLQWDCAAFGQLPRRLRCASRANFHDCPVSKPASKLNMFSVDSILYRNHVKRYQASTEHVETAALVVSEAKSVEAPSWR